MRNKPKRRRLPQYFQVGQFCDNILNTVHNLRNSLHNIQNRFAIRIKFNRYNLSPIIEIIKSTCISGIILQIIIFDKIALSKIVAEMRISLNSHTFRRKTNKRLCSSKIAVRSPQNAYAVILNIVRRSDYLSNDAELLQHCWQHKT